MFVVLGTSRCQGCSELLERDEVVRGDAVCCDNRKCAAVGTHLHLACTMRPLTCETCQQPMARAILPVRHVPDDWEDIVDAPVGVPAWKAALRAFLATPPPVAEWTYLGYRRGGHELTWAGELSTLFGIGNVQVYVHVHFEDERARRWVFGGAWIDEVLGSGIEVRNESLPVIQGITDGVVTHMLPTMAQAELDRISTKPSSGNWRAAKTATIVTDSS
jgi:hypothetical protein